MVEVLLVVGFFAMATYCATYEYRIKQNPKRRRNV